MYEGDLSKIGFQLTAAVTRWAAQAQALNTPGVTTVIAERTMHSDREIFARVSLQAEAERRAKELTYYTLQRTTPAP